MSVIYQGQSLKSIHEAARYIQQREDAAAIAFVVLDQGKKSCPA